MVWYGTIAIVRPSSVVRHIYWSIGWSIDCRCCGYGADIVVVIVVVIGVADAAVAVAVACHH